MGFKLNPFGRPLKSPEIVDLLGGCVGVIAGTEIYDQSTLNRLSGLRVISRCGSGMDNVDLRACKKHGIRVFNTPGVVERAVAELVLGLMLNLLRQINVSDWHLRNGQWQKIMGELILNKKVGLVGFGQVGQETARLLKALGAKVLYYDPFVRSIKPAALATKMDLSKLLKDCDIISLHVPLNGETKHLINAQRLSMMKKTAVLINTSRGGVVDEDALCSALKEGRLAAAALDVFEQEPYKGPLIELPNIILTPHIGSYAKEARVQMELKAVENILQGLKVKKGKRI